MPTNSPATPVTSILDADQVAALLGVPRLWVLRLVARGRLKATRLGDEGSHWRCLASDVESYVAAGAVDLQPPDIDGDASWFLDPNSSLADAFESKVLTAAEGQKRSNEQVEADIRAKGKFETTIIYTLNVDSDIRSVMLSPVPLSPFATPQDKPKEQERRQRLSSWAELWGVERLRDMTRSILSQPVDLVPALNRLYESPQAYGQHVAAGLEKMMRRRLSFGQIVPVIENGVPNNLRANYVLPFSSLLEGTPTAKLHELAF